MHIPQGTEKHAKLICKLLLLPAGAANGCISIMWTHTQGNAIAAHLFSPNHFVLVAEKRYVEFSMHYNVFLFINHQFVWIVALIFVDSTTYSLR